jgi:hypothetical protein
VVGAKYLNHTLGGVSKAKESNEAIFFCERIEDPRLIGAISLSIFSYPHA